MKQFLLTLILAACLSVGMQAQSISGDNFRGPHYTLADLDKLNKLELSKIYIEQVTKLNMLLPFIPFNQKGDAVSLSGMGIPNSKDNNDYIKVLDASSGDHSERTSQTLQNIIPYADKSDIINSILFLQSVIERVELGI
jgi:hypothetical protein